MLSYCCPVDGCGHRFESAERRDKHVESEHQQGLDRWGVGP